MDEHGMLMLHHTVSPMLSNCKFRLQVFFTANTFQPGPESTGWFSWQRRLDREIVDSNARLSPRELSREAVRSRELLSSAWKRMIHHDSGKLVQTRRNFSTVHILQRCMFHIVWTCFLFHIGVIHTSIYWHDTGIIRAYSSKFQLCMSPQLIYYSFCVQ